MMVDYTDTVCMALGVPRAKHRLDGGTHTTRAAYGGTLDDLIKVLKEQNMKSILSVDQLRVLDQKTNEPVVRWGVRGIYGKE